MPNVGMYFYVGPERAGEKLTWLPSSPMLITHRGPALLHREHCSGENKLSKNACTIFLEPRGYMQLSGEPSKERVKYYKRKQSREYGEYTGCLHPGVVLTWNS